MEGQIRAGWGSTVGDPRSSRESSRKQQHTQQQNQHKQQLKQRNTISSKTSTSSSKSCTNSTNSNENSKSSNRDTRVQKAGTEGLFVLPLASSRGTSEFCNWLLIFCEVNGELINCKNVLDIFEGQKRQGCVHNKQQEQGGPNVGEPNPEQLRPRGVWARRVVVGGGRGREEESSCGNSGRSNTAKVGGEGRWSAAQKQCRIRSKTARTSCPAEGARSVGARRVGGPKFRAFFFFLLPPLFSFFLSWEVVSLWCD